VKSGPGSERPRRPRPLDGPETARIRVICTEPVHDGKLIVVKEIPGQHLSQDDPVADPGVLLKNLYTSPPTGPRQRLFRHGSLSLSCRECSYGVPPISVLRFPVVLVMAYGVCGDGTWPFVVSLRTLRAALHYASQQ
jgi:hypothetical protein